MGLDQQIKTNNDVIQQEPMMKDIKTNAIYQKYKQFVKRQKRMSKMTENDSYSSEVDSFDSSYSQSDDGSDGKPDLMKQADAVIQASCYQNHIEVYNSEFQADQERLKFNQENPQYQFQTPDIKQRVEYAV